MTMTETNVNTQTYRVWIKATPEAVWDAITKSEWTDRYGYGGFVDFGDFQPGTPFVMTAGTGMQEQGTTGPMVDGEIIEVDAPRRLVQTWRLIPVAEPIGEPATPVTYDIQAVDGGVTRLTLTHDVDGAPVTAAMVAGHGEDEGAGGGWAWVLSDLKTLLETGSRMAE
jgi:uncharacterized protein YndB with AHSA1/START domain